MRVIFVFLGVVLAFCTTRKCFGQSGADPNAESHALNYARELYVNRLGDQAGIYDGVEYVGYPYKVKKGTPFFVSDEAGIEEVRYNGLLYKNVSLWFDLGKNQVLVKYTDNFSRVVLHSKKVTDFTIHNHHFVNLDSANAVNMGILPGFYDQIYKGKSELVVKRWKDFLISTDSDGVWMTFSNQKNSIFLRTGDTFTPVNSLKSVLNTLGESSRQVQAHLKQSKIKFKREREKAIMMMVSYYDQLQSKI